MTELGRMNGFERGNDLQRPVYDIQRHSFDMTTFEFDPPGLTLITTICDMTDPMGRISRARAENDGPRPDNGNGVQQT